MNITDVIDARMRVLINGCASLREEMAYSVFAGGKRLRPRLLLAACETAGGAYDDTAVDFACAVEMIHTYSLIHDDLPAMDDDALRRGKPTSHIKYGEANAILAGDALLNLAFEVMANRVAAGFNRQSEAPANGIKQFPGAERPARAMAVIAKASGASGMIAGQAADMEYEGKEIDAATLTYIHANKTGALIASCLEAGAILGGADDEAVNGYAALGRKMGLAFQIRDDILDVTATEAQLGKPIGSDEKNLKNTYVSVHGLERAREEYKKLSAGILEDLADSLLKLFTEVFSLV
jgi:geranylgeranyl diphosphate synthase type II